MDKPPCCPDGRVTNPCARTLYDARVYGRVDLPASDWTGWKIRGNKLIGPGGMTFTPATLRAAWHAYVKNEPLRATAC